MTISSRCAARKVACPKIRFDQAQVRHWPGLVGDGDAMSRARILPARRYSLSIDNETRMPSDLFLQMRADRLGPPAGKPGGGRDSGRLNLIPVRDVLQFATIEGARTTGLDGKTDISYVLVDDKVKKRNGKLVTSTKRMCGS
jgi:hypothetical protein